MATEPGGKVEVAVGLIQRDNELLLVYSRNWAMFTLPMSKRRKWAFVLEDVEEPWIDGAARAIAECLGRTSVPEFLLDVQRQQMSDREGTMHVYHFGVFRQRVSGDPTLVPGVVAEWVPFEKIRHQRPVSQTAIAIVDALREKSLL
jgi:hypothetical protein